MYGLVGTVLVLQYRESLGFYVLGELHRPRRLTSGYYCNLCMGSYLQNKISNDMLLFQRGKTPGGQEEFQIFDKHVKAVKPGLVIMPVLPLLLSTQGINFQTKNVLKPGLKIPFRMCAQWHKDEGNTHVAGHTSSERRAG